MSDDLDLHHVSSTLKGEEGKIPPAIRRKGETMRIG